MCLPSIHYIHGIFRHHFHFLKQGSLCARAKETAFNCLVAAVSDHVMRITPCGTKTFETVDGTWMWPRKKNMDWQRKHHATCQVYVNNYAAVRIQKKGKTENNDFALIGGGLNSSVAQRGIQRQTRGWRRRICWDGIGLDGIGMPTLIGLARIATKLKLYPWWDPRCIFSNTSFSSIYISSRGNMYLV